jgi:hypothetical protein
MAKFKFRTKDRIEAFGYVFEDGEFTEVPDSDERACTKLRNNGEFTQGRNRKKADD